MYSWPGFILWPRAWKFVWGCFSLTLRSKLLHALYGNYVKQMRVSLSFANCTSLFARKEALRASADILLFQETTMSQRGKQQILRFLPGCRRKVLWGSGPTNGSSTGVCCALPLHTPAVEVEQLGALQCFANDGRFQHVIISLSGLRLHIMNVYCKVGDCGYNEKLLWALLQYMAGLGPVPVLLGGDFQSDVINTSVFQLLYQHGWYNLARLSGLEDTPTWCHGGKWHDEGAPRTVNDLVLANSLALRMVESFEHKTDWNKALHPCRVGEPRPDHVPLYVVLSSSHLADAKVSILPLAPASPSLDEWPTMPLEDETALADAVWAQFSAPFQLQLASDVDGAYATWCHAATEYLGRRIGRKFPPRGHLAKPHIVPAVGTCSYKGPSEPLRLRQGRRAARCLRECLALMYRADIAPWSIADRIRFEATWERSRTLGRRLLQHTWPEQPSAVDLQEALGQLEMEMDAQLHDIIATRQQQWKHMVHDSDISSSKGLFDLLKPSRALGLQSVQVDGSPCFALNVILDKVREAWAHIFDRTAAPAPAAFLQEYAAEITARAAPCDLPAITGAALLQQVKKRSGDAVGGLDSWRTYELQQLPLIFWDAMALFLRTVENTGAWPQSMLHVNVTMLSKGEGTEPAKLRPISCAAVLRAVWASLRFRQMKPWLQAVCPPSVFGEPLEQALEMALAQEEALYGLTPATSTLFFDKTKCFDKLVLPIVSGLWAALGGPPGVLLALEGFYGSLTRRFKINGAVGDAWCSNAPLQGCALSVAMIHLLMGIWCQRNEALGLHPRAYFDDSRVSFGASDGQAATAAWNEVQRFDELSGQQTNTSKSFAVVPAPRFARHVAAATGDALEVKSQAKVLGHQAVGGKLRRVAVSHNRANACISTLQTARAVGIAPRQAERYVSTKAIKQFIYGCEIGRPGANDSQNVRWAASSALWTSTRQQRNPEVLFTLLRKGHLVDPFQAVPFQTVLGLRRLFLQKPALFDRASRLWQHCVSGQAHWVGPIRNLATLLTDLQLTWVDFDTVETRQGRRFSLWSSSGSFLAHRLREELKWCRWQHVHRKDMDGIQTERGVNLFATTFLLRGGLARRDVDSVSPNCRLQVARLCGGSLSMCMHGLLEGILAGAALARVQLAKMHKVHNATCIHCSLNTDETKFHMFWECPAWQYIRDATIGKFSPGALDRHPAVVTSECGITLNPDWLLDEFLALERMPQRSPSLLSWEAAETQVIQDERGVLVWTDGSTTHGAIPELVRSGLGIYYNENVSLNFHAALAGALQTNNRAELLAVVLAAEHGVLWQQPLVIHSDSAWVIDRARTLRGLQNIPHAWEHSDLWKRLWRACNDISITFVFIPSHLSEEDAVLHGLTPLAVKGNNEADTLAKRGEQLHHHPNWHARVQQFGQLLRDTVWIQVCMMFICLARNHKESHVSSDSGPSATVPMNQGWLQLQERLHRELQLHPTGGRRFGHKQPPVGQAGALVLPVGEPEVQRSSAAGARQRPLPVYALRHPPRLGAAVSMEWQQVPKPWLLVHRAQGHTRGEDNSGMKFQLGVKPSLLPALEWYLGQLQWPEEGRSQSVSFCELAIDFEIATGVLLEMPRADSPWQLGQRARAFYSAASAIGRYVERRPWPCGISSQTVNNLANTWGLPRCAGLPWRPTLLHPDAVEIFFTSAGNAVYVSDTDFFNQEPPLLVPSRESFWDAQVRRVPIYVRREERRAHEHVPQLQWCIQGDGPPDANPISSKLSKKVTDWRKMQAKVAEHNSTAAERKRHWIVLPDPPDFSLTGAQYSQLVKGLKVRCQWCSRERCLSVYSAWMEVTCPAC
eukprot:s497_g4.t1